jgi:hypothetical protein
MLVFQFNKSVMSKFRSCVAQGYKCGGLFQFSMQDCKNLMNYICTSVDEIMHSRYFHINFGCILRPAARTSLTVKFTMFNDYNCHVFVSKQNQPRKTHKSTHEINLAPPELIHLNLCHINSVLTKTGKKFRV